MWKQYSDYYMTDKQLLTHALSVFGPKLFTRLSQSELCDALGLCDQKQMAVKLGITYETFRWRVAKGKFPKPEIKLAKRAYYSQQQVDAIDNQQVPLNTRREHFMDDDKDDKHGSKET